MWWNDVILQELGVTSPDDSNAALRHRVIRDRVAQIVCSKLIPYHRANRITSKVHCCMSQRP